MPAYEATQNAIVDGNADIALALTNAALAEGAPAREILDNGLLPGMDEVGRRMKAGDCFIPEVLLSAHHAELPRRAQAAPGGRRVVVARHRRHRPNGDTTPAKLIEAMSDAIIGTPAGPVVMSAYAEAFIGTTNLYICEVQQGEDRYQWVPIKTYENVRNVDVSDMEASGE
jgi:B12 binding domain